MRLERMPKIFNFARHSHIIYRPNSPLPSASHLGAQMDRSSARGLTIKISECTGAAHPELFGDIQHPAFCMRPGARCRVLFRRNVIAGAQKTLRLGWVNASLWLAGWPKVATPPAHQETCNTRRTRFLLGFMARSDAMCNAPGTPSPRKFASLVSPLESRECTSGIFRVAAARFWAAHPARS